MRAIQFKIAVIGITFMLWGCDVDDPIYETPHPEHGKITLTTDWTNRTAGADVPANYTVKVGEYSATLSGATNTIDNLFLPGDYHANIYNTAEHITVSGAAATVASATPPAGKSGTFVNNAPGWFFSHAMDVTVQKDTDHEFTAMMRQQVVEMTFTVTPSGGTADRIESITATLGGVAGAMDMDSGTRSSASSVAMAFAKQSDGTWKATVRLLGIVGNSQPLTTTVTFTGGNPGDVEDTTDIHDEIEDNFGDGGEPVDPDDDGDSDIDLGTEIVETPTGAGFTAAINGWKPINGGSVIAN